MKSVSFLFGVCLLTSSVQLGAEDLNSAAIDEVQTLAPLIDEMSISLWDYSEIALRETQSAAFLSAKLEAEGFTLERGVAGMPTAFVATWGSGHPVIGVLAEFDALPGIGNEAVPERKPRADGVTGGQGCGHNLFGAASIGGAMAIKRMMEKHQIAGTVKLFGTPAEETLIGKVFMARDGVFDGLDAVLDWHPGLETKVSNDAGRAMNSFQVEFFGQAAHGAADPWNGRSALDAVELMNYGVNLMREHVKPTTRIHYVIPSGGDAPNIVPEYAKVWYYVRDINREEVQKYYDRILKIAEGAALGTETTHKVTLITGVHEYLPNRPIQETFQKNLEAIGPVDYVAADQEFAKALQRFLKVEEKGYDSTIHPLKEGLEEPEGGSTDVAEVSYLAPTAGFSVTTAAAGIPWHSWATTACHGTQASRKGAILAAKVIAATGIDLLTNKDLLKQAMDSFKEATKDSPYQPPIPDDLKPPLPSGQ